MEKYIAQRYYAEANGLSMMHHRGFFARLGELGKLFLGSGIVLVVYHKLCIQCFVFGLGIKKWINDIAFSWFAIPLSLAPLVIQ